MRKTVEFSFLVAAILFFPFHAATACTCVDLGICEGLKQAPVIFVGEVLDGGLETGQDPWGGHVGPVKLRVIEHFRGLKPNTHEVVVQLLFLAGMCSSSPYRKGDRVLVWAGRDEEGNLTDGFCTSSLPANNALWDLDFIRRYFRGERKTTIRGRVAANQEWSQVDYALDFADGYPVAGARITAAARGRVYTAKSDSRGGYEIAGLPAGSYQLHAELDNYTSRDRNLTVEVDNRGCATQNFGLWTSNSLEGSLFDSAGQPISGIRVFLQKHFG